MQYFDATLIVVATSRPLNKKNPFAVSPRIQQLLWIRVRKRSAWCTKDSWARFHCPFIRSKRISDDVAEMAPSVADEEPDREGLTSSVVNVGVCVEPVVEGTTSSWNVSKMSSIFQGMFKFPENIREYIQSLSESGNVYIPWKFQEIHIHDLTHSL